VSRKLHPSSSPRRSAASTLRRPSRSAAHAPGAEADLGHRRPHASELAVHHRPILPICSCRRRAAPRRAIRPYIARGSAAPPSDALPLDLPAHLLPGNRCGGKAERRRKTVVASALLADCTPARPIHGPANIPGRPTSMRITCRVPFETPRYVVSQAPVCNCLWMVCRGGKNREAPGGALQSRIQNPESGIPNPRLRQAASRPASRGRLRLRQAASRPRFGGAGPEPVYDPSGSPWAPRRCSGLPELVEESERRRPRVEGEPLAPCPLSLSVHGAQELGVGLGLRELAEEQFHRVHGREGVEHLPEDVDLAEDVFLEQQFFLPRAALLDVDRRVDAPVGQLPVEVDFEVPGALNSSKITSSMRDPVSMSAVATIVSEPAPSIFRAAPKNRLGFWSALLSTPPDRMRPDVGTTVLYARARRVIESSRITTSRPVSTRRFAFSITISAICTWRCGGSSKVEEITSPRTTAACRSPPRAARR